MGSIRSFIAKEENVWNPTEISTALSMVKIAADPALINAGRRDPNVEESRLTLLTDGLKAIAPEASLSVEIGKAGGFFTPKFLEEDEARIVKSPTTQALGEKKQTPAPTLDTLKESGKKQKTSFFQRFLSPGQMTPSGAPILPRNQNAEALSQPTKQGDLKELSNDELFQKLLDTRLQ
jgi:hypothetical protein